MLDFIQPWSKDLKGGITEIYAKFIVKPSNDLMIRGNDFYAVWDEETHLWSLDEKVALVLIDDELEKYAKEYKKENPEKFVKILYMWDAENGMIDRWRKFVTKQMRNSFHQLDETVIFANIETTRESYASKKLPYSLEEVPIPAYDELISTLYSEEERMKIEWAIGSVIAGDSKNVQKFIVMYGAPKTGKSTILNIIQDLFQGYWSAFDAKTLGSANSSFALEAFRNNPLIGIQHDGDLSRIEDNTRLNSLVSHETMVVNEKFRSAYNSRFNTFLIMGTNKPVKITDAKSGIIRRLIDVSPSGKKIPRAHYDELINQIRFELGGIASHCLQVYKDNMDIYDDYVPTLMIGASNDFYNFVLDSYQVFKKEDTVTLKRAWEMYKVYIEDARVPYPYSQKLFKEELKSYFEEYEENPENSDLKQVYRKFIAEKFEVKKPRKKKSEPLEEKMLELNCTTSLFDKEYGDLPAQYASQNETPIMPWSECKMTLKDINTRKLHYVRLPENHIVIDFDIKDADGNKSFELNAKAAAEWPPTYAELSKSGQGIHLHYIYTGDVSKLSRVYADNIEIKVFTGNSSLRRLLSFCNSLPIASISSGLPLKESRKKMVNFEGIKNEKALRTCIVNNLLKKNIPGTKPSIDFIFNDLESAYNSGMKYDVTDMYPDILAFASNSSNHASYCINKVSKMHFKSEEASEPEEQKDDDNVYVFFDVEVFPNLFVVVYKFSNDVNVVKLINPTPENIETLLKFKLIGFNCRRYDNHILYARLIGYSNEQLYELSQRIIAGSKNGFFQEAYNLSFTDVYDFVTNKQSLKKYEIELGMKHPELNLQHKECGLRWDEPVPKDKWEMIADYCANDVIATEAVFNYSKDDWEARQMLVELCKASGVNATVNDTTNSLTTKIIFGLEKNPRLVYTDLATGEQY